MDGACRSDLLSCLIKLMLSECRLLLRFEQCVMLSSTSTSLAIVRGLFLLLSKLDWSLVLKLTVTPLSSSLPNSVGSHFAGNVSRSSQIARSQQSQQRSHPPTLASSDLIFRQFVNAIVVPCCRLICMYLLGCLPNNFPLPDCLSLVDLRHHPASARKNTELS